MFDDLSLIPGLSRSKVVALALSQGWKDRPGAPEWPLRKVLALHLVFSLLWATTKMFLEAGFHLGWNTLWPYDSALTVSS